MNRGLIFAAAISTCICMTAHAKNYDFYASAGSAPSGSVFFTLPESPVVSSFAADGTSFTLDNVDYYSGAVCGPCTDALTFHTAAGNPYAGGFTGSAAGPYLGDQLFSGPVDHPHFNLGTFKVTLGDFASGYEDGTVTISPSAMMSTPEPASWALLVTGFGGIGIMMRARRRMLTRHPAAR